jgi:opine dehydrogenase
VGRALGLQLQPLRDVIFKWYGQQGAQGDTIHELLSTNPVYQTVQAPLSLNHRFLAEDTPYGLVPISTLGQATSTPTPVTYALITLTSILLN